MAGQLTAKQAQQFYIDALKRAVDSGGEGRTFGDELGERVDDATTAPQSVQFAYNFYYENVEQADWGSARLLAVTIGGTPTYAVYTNTDGDDGWLEIFTSAGDELGVARFGYDTIEFGDKETIRGDVG